MIQRKDINNTALRALNAYILNEAQIKNHLNTDDLEEIKRMNADRHHNLEILYEELKKEVLS